MPSAPEIVVVGSLNRDLTVEVGELPRPGETVLGTGHRWDSGGKGANQAVAAARLGRSVAMVGRVGDDDAGRELIAALRAEGVDVRRVAVDPDAGTGLAVITVDDSGENQIVVSPGANGRVSVADVEDAADDIAGAAVVLLQLEIPLEAVAAAARTATGTVILNPAPAAPLDAALLRQVDLLVPNRTELAVVAGATGSGATYGDQAAGISGPRAVIVTLGRDGALLVADGDQLHVPALDVAAVDAVAAGDAFCGALGDALVRNGSLPAAVRWAVAAGAVTVTRAGAQASLPEAAEVAAMEARLP